MTGRLARSYLYVSADETDRLASATPRGADAVIADLEDAVALRHKDLALHNVITWLSSRHTAPTELWVRVNPGQRGLEEVAALFHENLGGVCLPKVSGPEEIERVAVLLDELEDGADRQTSVSLMHSLSRPSPCNHFPTSPRRHECCVSKSERLT